MPATFPVSASASDFPTVEGYALEDYLGQGGMGVVYLARQLATDQLVALKMLRRADAASIYRIKREFRNLAEIVHPNLVRLLELHCGDGQWFFTMELVRGRDFLDHLGVQRWTAENESPTQADAGARRASGERAQRGPGASEKPDEQALRDGFLQLARGIAAIHEGKTLHCDIKPSNVMVDERGRVVVLDFGVSSSFGAPDQLRTLEGEISGTPEYMSPEQALGKELGPASDWYAFGVMLYEALCGTLPFSGGRLEVMRTKQTERPTRPGERSPEVPADLEQLCLELLEPEPEARPSAEQVLARLSLGQRPSEPGSLPPNVAAEPTTFVGRAAELARLREALQEVGPSRPVVAFVSGSSGIGKTTLVQQFLEELAGVPHLILLKGRCYERESVPYKAFDAIIDELSRFLRRLSDREVAELLPRDVRALSRVFPVLRRVRAIAAARGRAADGRDRVEIRRRASLALKELLARLADSWRVVISIDDVQWGDVDSARLLRDVLEPPDSPSLLVILSARDDDESPMLRELLREGGLEVFTRLLRWVRLSALAGNESKQLADALLGARSSQYLTELIAEESRGNPFFVRELSLYAQRSRGDLELKEAHGAHGPRFDAMLRERVSALPRDLREALEIVAVASQPVPSAVLRRVAQAPDAELPKWLELRDLRLVRAVGVPDAWSFECYHDRVRETVVGSLSPARVAECHRQLASALEGQAASDPEALLEHYRAAGDVDRAQEHVLASAQAASEALAFSRAARLYELALELVPRNRWRELGLERRLAESLANDGRLAEAAAAYERAAEHEQGLAAVELRRLAAQHFLTSGYPQFGLRVLRRALTDVGLDYPQTPGAAVARLAWERAKLRLLGLRFEERSPTQLSPLELMRADVCFSAAVGLAMTDLVRTAAFSAQHLSLVLKLGDPERIARGLTFEMGIAPGAGEEGLRWASRALPVAERLSERHGSAYHRGLFFLAQGHVAHLSGQWRAAQDWLSRAEDSLRDSQSADVHWALLSGNVLSMISAVAGGDLNGAAKRLPAIFREARQRGDFHSMALMAYPGVVLDLARDRPDAAATLLREVARREGDRGSAFDLRDFTALHCSLLIARYNGEERLTWARLAERWDAIEGAKLLVVNIVRVSALAERGSAALAMAKDPGGQSHMAVAKRCARRLEAEKLPHARALSDLLRARIASLQGDSALALALMTEASARLQGAGLAVHAECARRVVGLLMGGNMGRIIVTEVDGVLRAQGVRDPARFANMMVPGFPPA